MLSFLVLFSFMTCIFTSHGDCAEDSKNGVLSSKVSYSKSVTVQNKTPANHDSDDANSTSFGHHCCPSHCGFLLPHQVVVSSTEHINLPVILHFDYFIPSGAVSDLLRPPKFNTI